MFTIAQLIKVHLELDLVDLYGSHQDHTQI